MQRCRVGGGGHPRLVKDRGYKCVLQCGLHPAWHLGAGEACLGLILVEVTHQALSSWLFEALGDGKPPSTPPWERAWEPTEHSQPHPFPKKPPPGLVPSLKGGVLVMAKSVFQPPHLSCRGSLVPALGTWETWHLPSFLFLLALSRVQQKWRRPIL